VREVERIELGKLWETMEGSAHGARSLARAVSVWKEMRNEKALKILSLSGALIPSGLGGVIEETIKKGLADVLVTNGANIVHDVIEGIGGKHYVYEDCESDIELHKKKMNRIGSVLVKTEEFVKFEDFMQEVFKGLYAQKTVISVQELTEEIGKKMKKGVLRACYEKKVPVYSPGIADSMAGLQLFFFNQNMKAMNKPRLVLDIIADFEGLNNRVMDCKKVGAVILGGGVPKHFAMGCTLLRGGLDYALQITMDREETGSLSGAKLEEGISWGKVKEKANHVTVIGDAIMLFPLIVSRML
jgi:deoxyhypusine synthase